MERQLEDSNGKLQSLEQELQRISDMQDELEAAQRDGDEARGALETDLASVIREREELASTVGALQEGLRTACSEVEGKDQQNRVLSMTVTQLEKEKGILEEQLANVRAEVAQVESRFAVLRHELGEVRESAEESAKMEVDEVASRLSVSTQHAQKLLGEKATLEGRLCQLERLGGICGMCMHIVCVGVCMHVVCVCISCVCVVCVCVCMSWVCTCCVCFCGVHAGECVCVGGCMQVSVCVGRCQCWLPL